MTQDERLAHSLMLQFGLAPGEPNSWQLQSIKAAISAINHSGRHPSHQDWSNAVASACPSIGKYRYAGIDNSDLNTLLSLAIQSAGGRQ